MNLRSKSSIEKQSDLDSMFKQKRQSRACLRKQQPEQITDSFNIKHIDIPYINQLKYFPKYKLITGFLGSQNLVWNLIDDQVYENNYVNDKFGLKWDFYTGKVSIIESTDTIIKQGHFSIRMFDYKSLKKKDIQYWTYGIQYPFSEVIEIVHQQQIIFLNNGKCFKIAKLKSYKNLRSIFNTEANGFIDESKFIMVFQGEKLTVYFNSRNKTKLIRSVKRQYISQVSFSGRILSVFQPSHNFFETSLIDISNMKTKAVIHRDKKDRYLQSLFINELGLFLILYIQHLDIFDSSTFQLIGSEQLLDNKLHLNQTFQMASEGSQLIIFYRAKRKFKTLQQIKQQEI